MTVVSMKHLLEAGVHFGHQTRRWNPKMEKYIFAERNGIYIIDLQQTLALIEEAYNFIRDMVGNGGSLLFVGTKKQSQEAIRVRHRLTKLRRNLEGLLNMDKLPGGVFIIDPRKENIALLEARKLEIPVIAVVDTNCDPDLVDYVIPGNDDAIRAANLISKIIANAVLEGKLNREILQASRRKEEEAKEAEEAAGTDARKEAEQVEQKKEEEK